MFNMKTFYVWMYIISRYLKNQKSSKNHHSLSLRSCDSLKIGKSLFPAILFKPLYIDPPVANLVKICQKLKEKLVI